MRQYEMCEITLKGPTLSENWASAAPEAALECGGKQVFVKGFYAGEGKYKVRFLPDCAGQWKYHVGDVEKGEGTPAMKPVCTIQGEGILTVEPSLPENHGMVRAADCHFEYQDGSFFYPFGTTVYALMHQEKSLVEETFASLAAASFNKVRMCVFPKHYDFNHNDPELYAFEKDADGNWDVTRPCLAFWDYLDEILGRLFEMGIQCDLILFHPYDRWGFSRLSQKESFTYLDYLLRRLSAWPHVWWSMANEYDFVGAKSMEDWNGIDEFIAKNDPWRHLLSNHNCFSFYDFTRPAITHCSIQSKVLPMVSKWRSRYKKPICIDECCYEGNIVHQWGSISAREMTYRFWRTVVQGGYCTHGETFYSDDEVLWWAKGGKLRGESPARIAFLKKIVEALPGPIEPVENRLSGIANLPAEERTAITDQIPPEFRFFMEARLRYPKEEAEIFDLFEYDYAGHVGDEVYIQFFDIRTCAKAVLHLPADHKYRVELIDVYDMTRETIPGEFSGDDEIPMPGREGQVLIATKID